MSKSPKILSIEPDYPKAVYFACSFWELEGKFIYLSAYPNIFYSLKEIEDYMKQKFGKKRNISKEKIWVSDIVTVIPITLSCLFTLKNWERDKIKYKFDDKKKVFAFVEALSNLKKHWLLVAPYFSDNKHKDITFLSVAPFLISEDKTAIENFIKFSDWDFDIRFKSVGLYDFGKVLGLEWKTGRSWEVQKEKEKEDTLSEFSLPEITFDSTIN